MLDFTAHLAVSHAPRTIARYRSAYLLFGDFLDSHEEPVRVDALSRELLARFYAWLEKGRHDRPRSLDTKARIVEKVEAAWAWGFDEEVPGVPRMRATDWARDVRGPVTAPTWAEMAACVKACLSEGPRRLATILYYTGLRFEQAMTLPWSAVDLERGEMTVAPHKGLPGRIIPLSPHFVAELKAWGAGEGRVTGWTTVEAVQRVRLSEAWERAEVREVAWKRAPAKAFRRGVTTGLEVLGVSKERAELYVGRVVEGARAHYLDVGALPLKDVAAKIPPIGGKRGTR